MVSTGGLLLAAMAACLWPTDERAFPAILIDPQAPQDTTLCPAADTWTRQTSPYRNYGAEGELWSGVKGNQHALVRWDQAQIAAVVGGGTLVSARVEVTIVSSLWSQTTGEFSIHRVTKEWTELGATASCAIDTNTGNEVADCSGATAWTLTDPALVPWVAAPTDSVEMMDGQTGTVSFDVTGDVAAFLRDTANYGWVVRPRDDSAFSEVRVHSREAVSPPALILEIDADSSAPPVPAVIVVPDSADALLVVPPTADSGTLVLRDHIFIKFDDTTSGASTRALFVRYSAQVVGGYPLTSTYLIRIPDPGSTYDALESVMAQLRGEPGVRYVYDYTFQGVHELLGRYPNDGPGGTRVNWLHDTTDATRAFLAVRRHWHGAARPACTVPTMWVWQL